MLFNPAEPTCQRIKAGPLLEGDGAGNQNGLAPGFLIDVELGENSYGVDYYPEAGGRHLLTRRLTYQTPFGAGFPAEDDFERHDYALALFEAPPADPTRPGHAWRLAYRWPFSRFAGQPDGMSDQQWQQVQLDAMADLLLALAEGGVDVDFTDDFGNTDLQGFAIPPSDGWVLWYGPEFWLSPTAASLNVTFPWYGGTHWSGEKNGWLGLHRNELPRRYGGNNVVAGVFALDEFPRELKVSPAWP